MPRISRRLKLLEKTATRRCCSPSSTAFWPRALKSVLGFRQFLLRGLDKVRGEWSLVNHLYEIHTAPQAELLTAVLSPAQIVELARLRDFL